MGKLILLLEKLLLKFVNDFNNSRNNLFERIFVYGSTLQA